MCNIYFLCEYSRAVWAKLLLLFKIHNSPGCMSEEMQFAISTSKKTTGISKFLLCFRRPFIACGLRKIRGFLMAEVSLWIRL